MSHAYAANCLTHEAHNRYLELYFKLQSKIQHLEPLKKRLAIHQFNCSFFNPEFYSATPGSLSSIMYEQNRPDNYGELLLKEILTLLTTREIYSKTGIGYTELLHMDYHTYQIVKKIILEREEEQHKQLQPILNEVRQLGKKTDTLAKKGVS